MRTKALVVGSVAYDVIFSVHNKFKDEVIIKDGKITDVSMMLTANNKNVYFGGTGGNIAYGIGIQGSNPLLFSVVGSDFRADYEKHLINNGVNLKLVYKEGEYTATFYGISDSAKEQIGIFQPNTHGDYMDKIKISDALSSDEFDSIKIAIFSPGTGMSIRNHMEELRERVGEDVKIIFDPSQILSIFFTNELIQECIELSNIFIGNETEVAQLKTLFGLSVTDILNMGLECVIETKGKDGIEIHTLEGTKKVDPHTTDNFVEQTGAGDAFRAGLIKGLLEDLSIEDACKIGAILGSKNVESHGGQNYKLL